DKASLFQLSYAFMRRFAFVEVPIPTSVQYKQIIEASFADLRGDHSVPVGGDWDQHLVTAEKLFVALFAQDSGGLAAIDANVGPAIPRTMLRYIIERCSQFNAPPLLSVQELFLEAASTCLFPQYEGRRTEHARIVDAVVGVLPQESQRENESNVSKALSIWTGHKD
ncbi:MAG: hypothetical protein JWO19_6069, partial [Bryobacterales bacterium]|nr:hypothetical protein [Bryobacterales bacterium]